MPWVSEAKFGKRAEGAQEALPNPDVIVFEAVRCRHEEARIFSWKGNPLIRFWLTVIMSVLKYESALPTLQVGNCCGCVSQGIGLRPQPWAVSGGPLGRVLHHFN